jgi:two-component system, NarL family, response regulator
MKPAPITILLVDDHALLRQGVRSIIETQPDLCVIAEADSAQAACAVFSRLSPQVALIDLRLPDGTGQDVLKFARQHCPSCRCVILTTFEADEDIHLCLQLGASGYLMKNIPGPELIQALRDVANAQKVMSPSVALRLQERASYRELTAREREVLELIAKGLANKEIASVLNLAEPTVKWHVRSILEKLGVEQRTEAVTIALQRGLVRLD